MSSVPSGQYWANRAERRMTEYERSSEQTLRIIRGAYDKAQADLDAQIRRIYANYSKRYGLSPEDAEKMLASPAGRQEYEALLELIPQIQDPVLRQQAQARAASGAYAYRANVSQAIKDNIDIQMRYVADVEIRSATRFFEELIPSAYSHAIYDIQHGVGVGFTVSRMSPNAVAEILRNPWSGVPYSTRIWKRQEKMGALLDDTITSAFMSGKNVRSVSSEIAQLMQVDYADAVRLVRTETNYMANAADRAGYREAGIKRYRFLATLDARTSAACQEHDGESFDLADAVVGVNYPPLHPNCRSTTTIDLSAEVLAGMQRRARDPVTGESVLVPANMSYKKWRETFMTEDGNALDQAAKAHRDELRRKAEARRKRNDKKKETIGK